MWEHNNLNTLHVMGWLDGKAGAESYQVTLVSLEWGWLLVEGSQECPPQLSCLHQSLLLIKLLLT